MVLVDGLRVASTSSRGAAGPEVVVAPKACREFEASVVSYRIYIPLMVRSILS